MAIEKYRKADGSLCFVAVWQDATGTKRKEKAAELSPEAQRSKRALADAETKARALAATKRKAAKDGAEQGAPRKRPLPFAVLLAQFFEHYQPTRAKSLDHYEKLAKRWRRHLGELLVRDMTPDTVRAYKEARRQEGGGESSIRKELTGLATLFRWAVEWYSWNPRLAFEAPTRNPASARLVSRPAEPKHREEPLTDAQFVALLEHAAPWLRRPLVFLLATGFDRSDMVLLTWDGIDRQRCTIDSARLKTGTHRVIPYRKNAALRAVLAAAWETRRLGTENRVFLNASGEPLTCANIKSALQGVYIRTVRALLAEGREADAAIIKAAQPCRVFRHSFVSRLRERGVDRDLQRYLMGHGDRSMTDYYGAPPLERLEAAMADDSAAFLPMILPMTEDPRENARAERV